MKTTRGTADVWVERLQVLLSTELSAILAQEQRNENRVNLYSVGEYWAAFEKSAYLLEQMTCCGDSPMTLHVNGYPFPIVMLNVHYRRVDEMCKKHVVAKREAEFLQFLTHPIDVASYNRWVGRPSL